jgi:hypothetical protein
VFERLQALGRRDAASGPLVAAAAPAASQGAGR